MKKIFGLITFFGFVLMIGAAGGADFGGASFLRTVLLEALGMLISTFGMSALSHYKKVMRKSVKMRKRKACVCKMSKNGTGVANVAYGTRELA